MQRNDASASDEKAATRMGIIEANDLVYKLEQDLSVAVNRTHKTGFFQNNVYDSTQTSIAIFNSGADYIDPRRSFLSFTITLPVTTVTNDPTLPGYNTFISAYLGPNGSVLNFIDQVLVSSRSGDELTRINDMGQLMQFVVPWTFGEDWKDSIGEEIGLGSYIGGANSNGILSEMRRVRFNVPLYLLSPLFAYGRLLPSMLMSGLRVEIKWKPLEQAVQQFWENAPLDRPIDGGYPNTNFLRGALGPYEDNLGYRTNGKRFLVRPTVPNAEIGEGGLDPLMVDFTNPWTFDLVNHTLTVNGPQTDWNTILPALGPYPARPYIIPGIDSLGFIDSGGQLRLFHVIAIANFNTLKVEHDEPGFVGSLLPAPGMFRVTREYGMRMQRDFDSMYWGGKARTGNVPLAGYGIDNPVFNLCSIQMSDAVQRHLNEFSAVNGLEIVYADWDRTSNPLSGLSVPVYTEVRKSASRALQVFATVVSAENNPELRDSFASYPGSVWKHYQWQLGSLYFPHQRVQDNSSRADILTDNMLGLEYAFAADAFDRWHPKAAPTMLKFRGGSLDWRTIFELGIPSYREANPDAYLVPNAREGKSGSFANGGQCVAATLERSTMFDLSGIPINNSRTLALRGEFNFRADPNNLTIGNGMIFVFLKYVRVARVFLINIEVEQ